eukprot:6486488-Amphidinium_carterae.1
MELAAVSYQGWGQAHADWTPSDKGRVALQVKHRTMAQRSKHKARWNPPHVAAALQCGRIIENCFLTPGNRRGLGGSVGRSTSGCLPCSARHERDTASSHHS